MFFRRPNDASEVKAGDLIAFSGNSWISDLVNIATYGLPRWGISHVGLMGEATDGRLLLFESTTLDGLPCEIKGLHFNGTQAHSLEKVVAAYRGKIWRYPLYRPLYDSERQRLTQFLMDSIHTPYDEMGAMRSAGVGLSWVESLFREQDLTKIFCSEWIAAAFAEHPRGCRHYFAGRYDSPESRAAYNRWLRSVFVEPEAGVT